MTTLVRSAAILLLALPLPAQVSWFVDPVLGVDQAGNGSAANPYRTLTFAAAQRAPSGTIVFELRPGRYGPASGEVYPIALPATCVVRADPATTRPGDGAVVFESTLDLSATLQFAPSSGGSLVLRDLVMTGGMFRSLQINLNGSTAVVQVERCTLRQSRCIASNLSNAAVLILTIGESTIAGVDGPVIVNTAAGTRADVTIDRSVVTGGLGAAIELDAQLGGTIALTMRASRLGGGNMRGVLAVSDNRGAITTRLEHCLIHDFGRNVIGGTNIGGIADVVGGGGIAPRHAIHNCVFDRNRADAPQANPQDYTFGSNLVQQQSLAGLGGNVVGSASFVDGARGDYRLLPGSIGVDLGRAGEVTLPFDLDGDPRGTAPDLGPDELWSPYAYTRAMPRPGATLALRAVTAPGAVFTFVVGTARVPGSFGPGNVHLAGLLVALSVTATGDTGGAGEILLPVPNDRSLPGLEVFWQTVTALPPYLGANAWRTVVVP